MKRIVLILNMVLALCFIAEKVGAAEQPSRVTSFIAVMDLRCGKGVDSELGTSLTEVVIDELVKIKRFKVIDRANRDKILAEVGFQQSGCVDESCSVEAGRLLGVGKIVVGSVTKIEDTYLINLQLIDIQTAAIDSSARNTCKCDLEGLINSVAVAARKLMGETIPPTPATPLTDELVNEFFGITRKGDLAGTKVFLEKYPSLVSATEKSYGNTALIEAAYFGNTAMLQLLLDMGADINYHRVSDGQTALYAAATNGQTAAAKILLEHGADINGAESSYGNPPLFAAAWGGHMELTELLLARGADVNYRNKLGQTALAYAAASDNVEIAKLLLAKGADINAATTELGNPPLYDAAYAGKVAMVEFLLSRGVNVNFKNKPGQTALAYAVAGGRIEVARLLIAKGADINNVTTDAYANMPLDDAAWLGQAAMVEFLISLGADVNYVRKDGMTPLHLAAIQGHVEVAKILLKHGARINEKDATGKTPLAWAIIQNKPEMIDFLKKKGGH